MEIGDSFTRAAESADEDSDLLVGIMTEAMPHLTAYVTDMSTGQEQTLQYACAISFIAGCIYQGDLDEPKSFPLEMTPEMVKEFVQYLMEKNFSEGE